MIKYKIFEICKYFLQINNIPLINNDQNHNVH